MVSGMIYAPDEQGNNVQRLHLVIRIYVLYQNHVLL